MLRVNILGRENLAASPFVLKTRILRFLSPGAETLLLAWASNRGLLAEKREQIKKNVLKEENQAVPLNAPKTEFYGEPKWLMEISITKSSCCSS
jgi:hypothetical protein